MPENDKLKFSQLAEITRAQMAGSDYAVGYKANGDNKKWTFENQADFLLNDSDAGQEFQETFVKVQDAEPSDENNRIWVKETPEAEVEVPTYDEFEPVADDVEALKANLFPFSQLRVKQASFDPYMNDMSDFVSAISSAAWFTDYLYGAGFVKNLVYRKRESGSATITFYFIDPNTYKVIDKFTSNSSDQLVVYELNKRYTDRFYVAISSTSIGYRNGSNYNSYYFNTSDVEIGSIITPTLYGNVDLSFYLEYDPVDIEIAKCAKYGETETFTINNISIDSGFNNSSSSWWASEYHYPAGYVKSIRVTPNADALPEIELVDCVLNKVIFKGKAEDNVIVVEQLCENDFYVFVKGVRYKTAVTPWQKYYSNASVPSALDVGSLFTPSFSNGGYIFAIEITYKTVMPESLVVKRFGNTRMFVCGDSITAGYPYIANQSYAVNDDIRWGRQVARRLGFDVTFGAQSGNGWVYSTGSANALSITQETDFSLYDVAIYAWGTNDYGHDVALGDVDDNPSQVVTLCSRIKWIINKIYTDNPGIVLILSLPLNRSDYGTKNGNWAYGTANNAGYTLSEMCDKMIELCKIHGIPYIDNRVSAFNRYSLSGLLMDGLHPNYKGYKILGAHLTGEVGRIVSPYYPNALTESNS